MITPICDSSKLPTKKWFWRDVSIPQRDRAPVTLYMVALRIGTTLYNYGLIQKPFCNATSETAI